MKRRPRGWPTAVDLFCGCGGVTAGLKAKHFRVVAAVDNDPLACDTYRQNHRTVRLYQAHVSRVDVRAMRRELLGRKTLDLLVVCAPCQPFSSQGEQSQRDSRSRLILSSIRYVRVLRPRLVFFENVPGLSGPRYSALLRELRQQLRSAGYTVGDAVRVDCADYGVPQRRVRWVLLARRGKASLPPLPKKTTPTTVWNAIADLKPLGSGQSDRDDPLHFSREHKRIALRRLSQIPKNGGSRDALPSKLRLNCHKKHTGHPDVYGRMSWDDVAPTLTTGCTDITRGRFAHPTCNRAITLREASRLQTFPDSYAFSGSPKDVAQQIGNAVPVQFMIAFADALRAVIVGQWTTPTRKNLR